MSCETKLSTIKLILRTLSTLLYFYYFRLPAIKLLGLWLTEDLSWDRNCQEICKKAYSRKSLLTKLKYGGTSTEDLLNIYILFIRSVTEYCAVVFHSSLTKKQTQSLKQIQKTCLKIILGDIYIDYQTAMEISGLKSLEARRQERMLNFSLKSIKHPTYKRIFPLKETPKHNVRDS